jgi:signal transduction histidine kinase
MTRLIELVNKIMEYEKFENTNLELKKTMQSPYELISALIETQKIYLKEKKQKVSIAGSKNIELFFDKDLFTQLVYNLIGNFIKYAGENTELKIHISSKKIVFSDNGDGISKKEIPYLFEKFYQGKKEKS